MTSGNTIRTDPVSILKRPQQQYQCLMDGSPVSLPSGGDNNNDQANLGKDTGSSDRRNP